MDALYLFKGVREDGSPFAGFTPGIVEGDADTAYGVSPLRHIHLSEFRHTIGSDRGGDFTW